MNEKPVKPIPPPIRVAREVLIVKLLLNVVMLCACAYLAGEILIAGGAISR